mgnify:CR=1 FL=1
MIQNKKQIIHHAVFALVFILLIFGDRITKNFAITSLRQDDITIIPGVFTLHYLENPGAAWGIFPNAIWFFAIITIVVLGAMIYFYSRIPVQKKFLLLRFTIILLAAGAIGNFIDRMMWHYVVDFLYIKAINFPVFNVADIFICAGGVLFVLYFMFQHKDKPNDKNEAVNDNE